MQPTRELTLSIAFKTVLPPMMLSLIFDLAAGVFLGISFEKLMLTYPAVLIVIPGLMGLRGNVFGSLGSKISTALYLGSSKPSLSDDYIIKNVLFSIWAATIPAFILLAVAALRFPKFEQILAAFHIILNSSVTISSILGIMTAIIVIQSFKRGFDPDNIVGPAITTFADLISIPSIVLFIFLLETFKYIDILSALFVAILLFSAYISLKNGDRKAYKELLTIISLLALIQSITGNILQEFSEIIHKAALLSFAYPAVLGSVGNYGSIVVARTSTKLHLGEVDKIMSKKVLLDVIYIFLTSMIIAPLIFVFSTLISLHFGFSPKLNLTTFVSFFTTYSILVIFILFFSAFLSVLLYEKGIDPDNGGIPLATTFSDIFGTIAVVMLASLIVSQ